MPCTQMNRTLTFLDVSWNTIRKDSAEAIGEALRYNRSLRTLILSHVRMPRGPGGLGVGYASPR